MELRRLRYFIAAVEEGSLQAASRRMNVAQPALSRQIRELEESLGCALFERSAKGVRTTRAGSALYRDSLALLDKLENATQRAKRLGLEQQNRVRLGLVRTSSKYAFAHQALAAFKHDAPATSMEFVRASSPELVELLREGDLDLALLYERQVDTRLFDQRVIHLESYLIALHPNHRLAKLKTLHLGDLAGEPLIWLSRRNNADTHDALLQRCRVGGLEPVIGQEAESHDEQMEIVAISGGACLTPASTRLNNALGQLVFREVAGLDMELQLRLAWRKNLGKSPAAKLLTHFNVTVDRHQAELAAGRIDWARMPGGGTVVRCPEIGGR